MSNLLASLVSSAGALGAYDRVLEVTQNNVANASTPGYVKQRQALLAMPFDPSAGLGGGVRAGEVLSARNEYAEQAVRRQTLALGDADQKANSVTALESVFDISGDLGIPSALTNIFQSFSAWAQSPSDTIAKQQVIERATNLATAFQQSATALANVAQDSEHQLQQTLDKVNSLVGQLRQFNVRSMAGTGRDGGLDAQVHSTLEELSQYIDFTAMPQSDGTMSVLLAGKTALLIADRSYPISYNLAQADTPPPTYPTSRPSAHIVASDGKEITNDITTGQLGALLDFRNHELPKYTGDAYQPGDLNRMAKQFADRVNELLTSGVVTPADPPDVPAVMGSPLFQYDATNDTNAAMSLHVDPSVTPAQLSAAQPGPPLVSNGVALALSGISNSQDPADRMDGATYHQFYGMLASRVGSALNDATNEQQARQASVAQAKDLRQQMSGVSLDEEASILIQFQRAYEANSRFISVLNELTQATLNILQP